eukprot:363203-Chlamydomonas_euryale.AAC.6
MNSQSPLVRPGAAALQARRGSGSRALPADGTAGSGACACLATHPNVSRTMSDHRARGRINATDVQQGASAPRCFRRASAAEASRGAGGGAQSISHEALADVHGRAAFLTCTSCVEVWASV